jgi:asparagine synthase (glutamine-hydrolysing)
MCGITGFFNPKGSHSKVELINIARRMNSKLLHRGPDGNKEWADKGAGLALGHTRLAVLEISAAGVQPMVSYSGQYVIVFNGEIYNHMNLRNELKHITSWNGHSDTETLLACFELWGIEKTLKKIVGMFSIALWDMKNSILTLMRDRFGEKPLYYGWIGSNDKRSFVFASELKSIKAHPDFNNSISKQAVSEYIRFQNVPAPLSIYKDIYKLMPGAYISIDSDFALSRNYNPYKKSNSILGMVHYFWSLKEAAYKGSKNPINDKNMAIEALHSKLIESVKLQTLSDVPVGAFLSGGIDSSTIVALMQSQSMEKINTFTIGFEDPGFDESQQAATVAQHLGTNHNELFVTSKEAMEVIPRLPIMYDEPFSDSSQIPTHLVCQAAKQSVTVALGGDAGDELFGGYNRYIWAPDIWRYFSIFPFPVRKSVGKMLQKVPTNILKNIKNNKFTHLGDKIQKLALRMETAKNFDDFGWSLTSDEVWHNSIVKNAELYKESGDLIRKIITPDDGLLTNSVERMMYEDTLMYLPNDILCKVDRASMAIGLEVRSPLLDHRVAELAWRLPIDMKISGQQGKWALRQILYEYVPKDIIDKPKTGFSVPIGQWLRGPLRPWAEELLDKTNISNEGYFNPDPIHKAWEEHKEGKRDWTSRLWSVLMFQSWLQENS